jgi:putative transposase
MCRALSVARSGYYAWIECPKSDRELENEKLAELIRASWIASGGIYGSPRILGDLREAGIRVGKNRVARLMKKHGIRGAQGYKRPRPLGGKPATVAPNLLKQQFETARPNEAWVTDITYIRTWQGWLYLAVVIDLHSRVVVGWSMKPTLARTVVLDALLMAVWRRKPTDPVVVHSDQGSQYGSDDWRRFCREHNLTPSMSRRGNCYDNAVAESFFSSLKKERVRKKIYRTRADARADLFDYIEVFYNRKRRHSHTGGLSPMAFEDAFCSAA